MKKLTLATLLSTMGLFAMAQEAPLKDTNHVVLHDNTILIVDSQNRSCHTSDEVSHNDSLLREHKAASHEVHKKYKYSEAIVTKKKTSRVSASTKKHH